ncbi:unnamed protein product, partial [Mesorhabditis belari]|uniref:Uncharacterized protein n=1 Tax=Mesorhabditis belari TaxID=2138241 RepID=A0AAF3EQV0_9BILA
MYTRVLLASKNERGSVSPFIDPIDLVVSNVFDAGILPFAWIGDNGNGGWTDGSPVDYAWFTLPKLWVW